LVAGFVVFGIKGQHLDLPTLSLWRARSELNAVAGIGNIIGGPDFRIFSENSGERSSTWNILFGPLGQRIEMRTARDQLNA